MIKIITIKKRGGGTRKQKVQVLKSGKFKFIKNSTKSSPKRKAPKRRSAPKRKAPKRKTIKQKKAPKRTMVKKNFVSKTLGNPLLKKVLMAAGAVSVATSVAALVAPSLAPTIQKPLVKAVIGFAAGDIVGAASQFLLSGGIGSLGGGSANTNTSNGGFA